MFLELLLYTHGNKQNKFIPPVYIIWSVVLQQLIHLEIIEIVYTFYCGIYSEEYTRNSKEMLMMMDEFSVYFLALLLIVVA